MNKTKVKTAELPVGLPVRLMLAAAAIILALPSFLIVLHPGVRSVTRTPEGLIVAADA